MNRLTQWLPLIIVSAAVIVAASLIYDRVRDRAVAQWEQRAATAIEETRRWREQARADSARADSAIAANDLLRAAADDAHRRAGEIARSAAVESSELRRRIAVVRDSAAPDSARDRIIDELAEEADRWRLAFQTEAAAYATLERSAIDLRGQVSTLQDQIAAATARVDSLAALIEDRPGERAWWVPRVIVGGFAGACTDREGCAGTGVAFGWEI